MADDNLIDQDEIEQLLNQTGGGGEATNESSPPPDNKPVVPLAQGDIEALLGNAGEAGGATPDAAEASPSMPAPDAESDEDNDKLLGQDDIEKLLSQAQGGTPGAERQPAAASKEPPPRPAPAVEGGLAEKDVDYLLNQAEQALESINKTGGLDLPDGVTAFRLEDFSGAPASTDSTTMDLIRDVGLDLKIELGRTHMYLEDVLKLRKGSVVPLDKLAGDPVDIYVNGRLIARGEVLVLNDNFCVRVAELIAGENIYA